MKTAQRCNFFRDGWWNDAGEGTVYSYTTASKRAWHGGIVPGPDMICSCWAGTNIEAFPPPFAKILGKTLVLVYRRMICERRRWNGIRTVNLGYNDTGCNLTITWFKRIIFLGITSLFRLSLGNRYTSEPWFRTPLTLRYNIKFLNIYKSFLNLVLSTYLESFQRILNNIDL